MLAASLGALPTHLLTQRANFVVELVVVFASRDAGQAEMAAGFALKLAFLHAALHAFLTRLRASLAFLDAGFLAFRIGGDGGRHAAQSE
jgi:hypothetical protein